MPIPVDRGPGRWSGPDGPHRQKGGARDDPKRYPRNEPVAIEPEPGSPDCGGFYWLRSAMAVASPAAASAELAFKPALDVSVGDFPQDVASADLNGDGYNDLVTANSNSDDVTVLLGGPVGLFPRAETFRPATAPGGRGQ